VPFLYPHLLVIWMSGMVAGAAVATWTVLGDSPPAYIENWRTGAEGERKTAKRLRALDGKEWLIVHDVDAGRGNYDHIVVGPAGVFVLDTKWPSGAMRIKDGVPWVTRRDDPDAEARYERYGPGAKAAAAQLWRQLGRRAWVEPVVVVWCEFPAGVESVDGCTFIHGSQVAAWLEKQPARLTDDTLGALRAGVEKLAREPSTVVRRPPRASGARTDRVPKRVPNPAETTLTGTRHPN
jgi:Nuclease-related domain